MGTCTASATKSRLRFLQATTEKAATPKTEEKATVATQTSAENTVNPALVNQSNPIVNVPVNNTLTVTDSAAPDISKNFVVKVTNANANGLVIFTAKYTSALRCTWQIADSAAAPATGSAIATCTDTQWCGQNFGVGTLVSATATNYNNLKAFSSGKSYAIYFACSNDVPYSTTVSNIFSTQINLPDVGTNKNKDTDTKQTKNTDATTAGFIYFRYTILAILILLI